MAFQNNAFQGNAFQTEVPPPLVITPTSVALTIGTPSGATLDTGITPSVVSLALSTPSGAVLNTGITPTVGALTVAGTQSLVSDIFRTPVVGSLLTGTTAGSFDTGLKPSVSTLAFGSAAAHLNLGIAPTVSALALGVAAGKFDIGIKPSAAALSLTGYSASFSYGLKPAVGTLTIGVSAPLLSLSLTPSVGALTIAASASLLSFGFAPSAGALNVIGYAPTIPGLVVMTPGTGILKISTYRISVSAAPGTATLALSYTSALGTFSDSNIFFSDPNAFFGGFVDYNTPIVIVGSITNVVPASGALVVSGQSPILIGGVIFTPSTGRLLVTTIGMSDYPVPGTGTLTLISYAPTLFEPINTVVIPNSGTVALTGLTGSVLFSHIITPSSGLLIITTFDTVRPATGVMSIVGISPAISPGVARSPGTATLVIELASMWYWSDPTIWFSDSDDYFDGTILGGSAPAQLYSLPSPYTDALILNGIAPNALATYSLFPSTGILTTLGHAPSFVILGNHALITVTGALSIAGNIPVVGSLPATARLSIAGNAPKVNRDFTLKPNTASMLFSFSVTLDWSNANILFSNPGVFFDGTAPPSGTWDWSDTGVLFSQTGTYFDGTIFYSGSTYAGPHLDFGYRPNVKALTIQGAGPSVLSYSYSLTPGTAFLFIYTNIPALHGPVIPPPTQVSFYDTPPASMDWGFPTGTTDLFINSDPSMMDLGLTPQTGALALVTAAASTTPSTLLQTQTGTVLLTGIAPATYFAKVPFTGTLTLAGTFPHVQGNTVMSPATAVLALVGPAPAMRVGIQATTAAMSLTGTVSTLQQFNLVIPGTGTLTLTGNKPNELALPTSISCSAQQDVTVTVTVSQDVSIDMTSEAEIGVEEFST